MWCLAHWHTTDSPAISRPRPEPPLSLPLPLLYSLASTGMIQEVQEAPETNAEASSQPLSSFPAAQLQAWPPSCALKLSISPRACHCSL